MKQFFTLLAAVLFTATTLAQGNLTVTSGGSLTVSATNYLTAAGNFSNNGGTVTLNSTADNFSSLIVQGTATGDIVYNRFVNVYDDLNGGGWDFVGAPTGMTIADFITANGSNIQVLGDDYAFAQYDNATGQYTRYATASQNRKLYTCARVCIGNVTRGSAPTSSRWCTWNHSSLYWCYGNYISKHQYC